MLDFIESVTAVKTNDRELSAVGPAVYPAEEIVRMIECVCPGCNTVVLMAAALEGHGGVRVRCPNCELALSVQVAQLRLAAELGRSMVFLSILAG